MTGHLNYVLTQKFLEILTGRGFNLIQMVPPQEEQEQPGQKTPAALQHDNQPCIWQIHSNQAKKALNKES